MYLKRYNIIMSQPTLEEIFNICSKILEKLDNLETRVSKLEENAGVKIDSLENLVELKEEDLELSKDEVLKELKYRDYRSVLNIFRKIYNNKTNAGAAYPIKITGKRSYEYYCNNKWNPDVYGHRIGHIICLNVQNLFIKHNVFNGNDCDEFLLNQKFIYKLSDEKYKKEITKVIIEEVRIN